jgi:capsular polysaccharide biosynthesis protein
MKSTMSTAAAPLDPLGRSVINAVRRWAYIPIQLATLGAVTGGLVGMAARPSAEALVSVRSTAVDGAGLERATETAALAMNTTTLFRRAAGEAAVDPDDLRSRTKIGVMPNTQTISVTVTATTSEQAAREATALADAAVELGSAGVPNELRRITDEMRKLIREHAVPSTAAEQARLARLGEEVANQQSAVLAGGEELSFLQEGAPARVVPSTSVLVAMGALVGVLLGLGVAQLLGVRRGTVQSGRELAQLYPEASVIHTADLRGMLALEPRVKTLFVAGVRRNVEDMVRVTERVRESLILDGREVLVRDSSPSPEEPANGHINVVPTMLNETVLRRSARDDGTLLIVPVQPRVTRLEALDVFAPRLNDRSYLLVDERVPEWN